MDVGPPLGPEQLVANRRRNVNVSNGSTTASARQDTGAGVLPLLDEHLDGQDNSNPDNPDNPELTPTCKEETVLDSQGTRVLAVINEPMVSDSGGNGNAGSGGEEIRALQALEIVLGELADSSSTLQEDLRHLAEGRR